jgi:hypothetical protein
METTVSVPEKAVEKKAPPQLVQRFFTTGGRTPFDTVEWKTVDAVIVDAGGVEKFRLDGVEVFPCC